MSATASDGRRLRRYLEGELAELYRERPSAASAEGDWTAYAPLAEEPQAELDHEPEQPGSEAPEREGGRRFVIERVDEEDDGSWVLEGALRRLEALEAVGVLDGASAAAWRARFNEAWELVDPDPREQFAEPALSHARGLLEEALARVERVRPGAEGNLDAELFFDGALNTLRQLGAISDDEHTDWFRRRIERAAPGVSANLPPDAKHSLVAVAIAYADEEWDDGEEHEPPPSPVKLGPPRRVLLAPSERHRGLRLTAIQIHDEGLQVGWHLLVPRDGDEDEGGAESLRWFSEAMDTLAPAFELRDDAGGSYESLGLGDGGSPGGSPRTTGPHVLWGNTRFGGAIPPQATRLELRSSYGTWTVPL